MPGARDADPCCTLGPGELVRLVYRLGRQAASGVLTLAARPAPAGDRPDVLVLRRGAAVSGDGELARRALATRLVRATAAPSVIASFEAGVAAYPPGALHQVPLAGWARSHLEGQLDGALAERLVHQLAGARLAVRPELAPAPADEADRRMLAALAVPRRLEQIRLLARAPRYRLLAFVHFLRGVGALAVEPAATDRRTANQSADPRVPSRSAPDPRVAGSGAPEPRIAGHRAPDPRVASHSAADPRVAGHRAPDPRVAAMRLLGIDDATDVDAIKRAYRRLARALHPDLQPGADPARRKTLERRFAEVAAAYEALTS